MTSLRRLSERMLRWYVRVDADEAGATAIEYALMISLIAMVVIAAVAFLGTSTSAGFDKVQFSPP